MHQNLARLAWFYYDVGLVEKSMAASEEAIRILKQYHHPADLLAALYSRAALALTHNQLEIGVQVLDEGLSLARSVGDKNWEGRFLVWSGISYVVRNDLASAQPLCEAGLLIFEGSGRRWDIMRASSVLGDIEESKQNYKTAKDYFQKSLEISDWLYEHRSMPENFTCCLSHLEFFWKFGQTCERFWSRLGMTLHIA